MREEDPIPVSELMAAGPGPLPVVEDVVDVIAGADIRGDGDDE